MLTGHQMSGVIAYRRAIFAADIKGLQIINFMY
jgi:hypothetical protein